MTALQTAAMDPRTGKIDLDLITTGISTSSRLVREQKRGALRDLLQSLERTTLRWAEVNRLFQEQSDQVLFLIYARKNSIHLLICVKRISDSDFNGMLQDLCDEGYVHLTGRTNAEKMIRKTK